jgi:Flp pilus assembly protein TadD
MGYCNLACALEKKGTLDAAMVAARTAVQFDPKDIRFRNLLTGLLHKTGNVREAIAVCREAVRLDPANLGAQSLSNK